MKTKIRRLISGTLQIFGLIFLLLLAWKSVRTFLGSFDKNLQGKTWTLVSLPDSSGTRYSVDSGIVNLFYKNRKDVVVTNASCGEHHFTYGISKFKPKNVYHYTMVTSCPLGTKANDVFNDFLGSYMSAACYKVEHDTLEILSYRGDTLVFRNIEGENR